MLVGRQKLRRTSPPAAPSEKAAEQKQDHYNDDEECRVVHDALPNRAKLCRLKVIDKQGYTGLFPKVLRRPSPAGHQAPHPLRKMVPLAGSDRAPVIATYSRAAVLFSGCAFRATVRITRWC
jgi:hypothetical protein